MRPCRRGPRSARTGTSRAPWGWRLATTTIQAGGASPLPSTPRTQRLAVCALAPIRWTSRRTSASWRSPQIPSAILFARAIVVDDGSTCAVLVGIDLGAASNQIVGDAIARATKSTGCPAQNFIISATHTHSSNTQGLGQGAPAAKTVADAIVEAAIVAKSKLAPARVGCGTTKVDLNVKRRRCGTCGSGRSVRIGRRGMKG
jgi:hypothetical protein